MNDPHYSAVHLSITGEQIDLSLENGFPGASSLPSRFALPANVPGGNCSSISSYERLNAIGEGAYGIVSRARDKRDGSIVALKQIRVLEYERNNGIPLTALREISILRSLRHQNVLNVLEVAVDDNVLDDVYMVMEYCEQDLASLLDEHRVQFSLSQVKCLTHQLLEGLEYLHRKDIIHRDIKLENLLLKGKGQLKIADFGMAREWAPRPLTPGVVTIWYRAPELLLGCSRYTPSVDIWSAGLFVGELLLQMPVLDGNNELEQLSQIVKLLGSPKSEDIRVLSSMGCPDLIRWQQESMPSGRADNLERRFLSRSSKGTVGFLSGLLRWDPKARWTASEALGKSRSKFAAAAEEWWRESPRAVARELLPTFPVVKPDPDDDLVSHKDSNDNASSGKRQKASEGAETEFGGFIFDFSSAEPATKLPPRKRRR
ncbi:kinase-like domain-containing protein [Macrophomina phaseolina]|uniref:cyclin-dependent kinase n=1 Tax=Macrophomina phaseolina TaxID=35725 RepID=A0ABQ8GDP3_9PEZI|nr:kinase-like domain-containing protein [Macrophomina phaseolina]